MDVRQVMERALLAQHTPAALVTNADGDVVYVHGRTGYYLEPAEGEASLNALRMAREGLRFELTTALRKAVATQGRVVHKNLAIRTNGGFQNVNLIVQPMPESPVAGMYLIVFEPAPTSEPEKGEPAEMPSADKDQRITALERELHAKEEYLQTTIEELETSNEELTSTNEELQSANEELQSTNEELETSKEELQSVNEELMTVNMELQKKIEELRARQQRSEQPAEQHGDRHGLCRQPVANPALYARGNRDHEPDPHGHRPAGRAPGLEPAKVL